MIYFIKVIQASILDITHILAGMAIKCIQPSPPIPDIRLLSIKTSVKNTGYSLQIITKIFFLGYPSEHSGYNQYPGGYGNQMYPTAAYTGYPGYQPSGYPPSALTPSSSPYSSSLPASAYPSGYPSLPSSALPSHIDQPKVQCLPLSLYIFTSLSRFLYVSVFASNSASHHPIPRSRSFSSFSASFFLSFGL